MGSVGSRAEEPSQEISWSLVIHHCQHQPRSRTPQEQDSNVVCWILRLLVHSQNKELKLDFLFCDKSKQ